MVVRDGAGSSQGIQSVLLFSLLQLTISILIAMPAYLFITDNLGRLATFMGIKYVQHSLKAKMLLLGAFVPLLSYSLLLEYYWLNTGALSFQTLMVWGVLGAVTLVVSLLSRISLQHSLRPVTRVLNRSGAIMNRDLAQMNPQSTDEIGYLTQTLGQVFQRLADQESHMLAVVDNAAEGIIVTDENGFIDTFNLAAERLFGYAAAEVRGRSISRLVPLLTDHDGLPHIPEAGQELQGLYRNGSQLLLELRASKIQLSGKEMYIYLMDDISEKKEAEERQLSAEIRYRDLVETAHDLVWSMDAHGTWTYLNSATISIYDYAPHEMIDHPVSEFMAPEYAEQERIAFAELLEDKELHQFETVHLDRHGKQVHLSFSAKAQKDSRGDVIRITGTARNITEQKLYEQQLTYQAEHDALTSLYNRRYFQRELERVVARVTRSAATCAILYLDLDQFKYINDTMGHAAGDRLLIDISEQLSTHVREGELLARFGGDEFTVLLYNIDENKLLGVAENFRRLFDSYKFVDGTKSFSVSCSIGAAIIDGHTRTAEDAMSHADFACNIAKTHGRNCVHLYSPEEQSVEGMAEDMGWAARVREMLDNDRLMLVYQPIVSVRDNDIHSYEVLMRMPLDDGQIILPGGFMPAAERFGLIHNIDRWMVHHSILKMAELKGEDIEARFAINLSGHAFDDKSLLPLIEDMMATTGVNPDFITFEISETAVVTKLNNARHFIDSIRALGCHFSLDDFGSGFCSFTHLKTINADMLKIDSSLIVNIARSAEDLAMVKSINEIAHVMGRQTVAESVEDSHTCDLLKQMGVDFVQGHYLGKPLDHLSRNEHLPSSIHATLM
jgi:diguanylate cyclase (GGDEF)-like protein/PAS domain S-box-containing protein